MTHQEGALLDISEIISELSRHERIPNSLETKKLLIRLAMWMRFPSDVKMQRSAVFYASTIYAKQKWDDVFVGDLTDKKIKFIFDNICLSNLIPDAYSVVIPDFNIAEDCDKFCPQNEFEYVSNIMKFIFWYKPKEKNHRSLNYRDFASLNKAFLFMALDGFGKRMVMTKTTCMKRWNALHAASPFHYVDIVEFNGRFRLNPHARPEEFEDALDRLAANSECIRKFLHKCHTAVEMMRQKLDAKAIVKIPLPNFPDGFPQIPLATVELPDSVSDLVESNDFYYESGENKAHFMRLYREVYGEDY